MVSWLPLYHDMGLVGLLMLPMTTGTDLVLGAPQDFLGAPARWMEWLCDFGGTATAGPNFSYVARHAGAAQPRSPRPVPLRLALNGAEPVDPDSVDALRRRGRRARPATRARCSPRSAWPRWRSAARSRTPCAACAPTRSIAGCSRPSATPPPPTVGHEGTRRLALLGRPVPGLEIRIVDPVDGSPRLEREVGELEIRGTSVTPGYYKRPDATEAAFRGEWLRTGDLAYLLDGELVLCGRIKDVIIVGGRNVFPEDVERAVAVDRRRARRQRHRLRRRGPRRQGRRRRRGRDQVGRPDAHPPVGGRPRRARRWACPPSDIVLVAPGTLPKTSSGKLQRSLCRERYLTEALEPV